MMRGCGRVMRGCGAVMKDMVESSGDHCNEGCGGVIRGRGTLRCGLVHCTFSSALHWREQ